MCLRGYSQDPRGKFQRADLEQPELPKQEGALLLGVCREGLRSHLATRKWRESLMFF